MQAFLNLIILSISALLEVGGDALVRWGLQGKQILGFVLGGAALLAYGTVVNTPKWEFGRLMGVYIAVFFVVSQLISHFIYHEELKPNILTGGSFVVIGGLIMTFWQPK
jgi:small multidrug resistance family-3 protein